MKNDDKPRIKNAKTGVRGLRALASRLRASVDTVNYMPRYPEIKPSMRDSSALARDILAAADAIDSERAGGARAVVPAMTDMQRNWFVNMLDAEISTECRHVADETEWANGADGDVAEIHRANASAHAAYAEILRCIRARVADGTLP